MLEPNLSWNEVIRILRVEYQTVLSEDIKPEIKQALQHIPSFIKYGVRFPGVLPLMKTYAKSKGKSEALFFFSVFVGKLNQSDDGSYAFDELRVTTIARFKQGGHTNCIAFTGDPEAIYWQHFFDRYMEREENVTKGLSCKYYNDKRYNGRIHPEELYLDILSKDSMWHTTMMSYKSDKYDNAYVRPWDNGIALGSRYKDGELRGTYISREMMREEQDSLCEALVYMGDIRRIYNYNLEDDMEKTMIKYYCGSNYAKQIRTYFIYYWLVKRLEAYFTLNKNGHISHNKFNVVDEEIGQEATCFFEEYGLPIEYGKDCVAPWPLP